MQTKLCKSPFGEDFDNIRSHFNSTPSITTKKYKSGELQFHDRKGGCILYSEINTSSSSAVDVPPIYVVTTAHVLKMKETLKDVFNSYSNPNRVITSDEFHNYFPLGQTTDKVVQVNIGSLTIFPIKIVASGLFYRLAAPFADQADDDYDWVILSTTLRYNHQIPKDVEVQRKFRSLSLSSGYKTTVDPLVEYLSQNLDYEVYLPDGTIVQRSRGMLPGYSGCLASRGVLTRRTRTPYEASRSVDSTWGIVSSKNAKVSHERWFGHVGVQNLTWDTSVCIGWLVMPEDGHLAKSWESINKVDKRRFSLTDYFTKILTTEDNANSIVSNNDKCTNFSNHRIGTFEYSPKAELKMSTVLNKTILKCYDELEFIGGTSWKFTNGGGVDGEVIDSGMFIMSNILEANGSFHKHDKSKKKKATGQIHAEVLGLCKVLCRYYTHSSRNQITHMVLVFHMDGRPGRPNKPCQTCYTEIDAFILMLEEVFDPLDVTIFMQ